MSEEYLDVVPLGALSDTEEITISLIVDTIDNLRNLFNKEKHPMESFDSFVNRLLDESIEQKLNK